MAFNPFDVFRRNQKILFAGLTVMIMFMFTLQFGQGDFFSQVPRWLASGRKSGTVLAEVNGSKVYSSELEQARADRVLANTYMLVAARQGADSLATYVKDGLTRASAENKPAFEAILQARQQLPMLANPELQNPNLQFLLQQIQQQVGMAYTRVQAIAAAPNPKGDDATLAQSAKLMMDLTAQASRGRMYFDNQPNDTNRDVMDFLLWRKKADQLGIKLDAAAVSRLNNDEFLGKLSNADWKTAEDAVRGKQGFSADQLRRALADEYRVRAAQTAVIGSQTQRAGGQVPDAPYDYFRYYGNQTNASRYGLLTVAADEFIPKVTATPTEGELSSLFNKARNVEPDPRRTEPGIKEPRRIKLGFVEIAGTEPFYKAKADAAIKTAEGVSPTAPAAALTGAAVLAGFEPPTKKLYATYKQQHAVDVRNNWGVPVPFSGGRPLDTHMLEPLNVASLTAALATGQPLAAATAFVADGFASDKLAKQESVLPLMVAPLAPGIGSLAGVLGSVGGMGAFTQPLPYAAVRGLLADKAREEAARAAVGEDMISFGTELAKLGSKKDEAEAKVAAFAKERGLTVGASERLRDLFDLATDPGLKKLEERFTNEITRGRPGFVDPVEFAIRFYGEADPLNANRLRPSTALYKPQAFPETGIGGPRAGETAFLVWRTEDKPAEAPRRLDDPEKNINGQTARDKTLAAWKRLKARELAKKEADDLAKRLGTLGTNPTEIEMKLRDEATKLKLPYHELSGVSPLVNNFSFMPGRGGVTLFDLGRTQFIPYPSQPLLDVLMDNRAKALSTTGVASDLPGDRVYVTVLVQKQDKSPEEFGLTVYGPAAQSQFNEIATAVAGRHQLELKREKRDRAVSLLKAEFRYDKESDELNKKGDLSGDF